MSAGVFLPLVCLVLSWTRVQLQATCPDVATVGLLFRCQLQLEDFNFPSSTSGDESLVSYVVGQEGYAGKSSWIQATRTPTRDGLVLYGTPETQDLGRITLLITAQRNDFETRTRTTMLTVIPLQGMIVQYLEFFVTNHNLDELLGTSKYSEFEAALREVYPLQEGNQSAIIAVINPRARGILAPPPPAKLGVVIQVTPGVGVDAVLPTATPPLVLDDCVRSDLPINFNQFSIRGFQIDWCRYRLQYQDIRTTSEVPQRETPPILLRVAPPTTERSSTTLIAIMVVVGMSLLMLLSALACVFYGRRKHSYLISKTQRVRNDAMLYNTKSSTEEVLKAQIVLRALSLQGRELAMDEGEERPDTACLEYQDAPDNREFPRENQPPPNYQYNEHLLHIASTVSS